MPYGYSYLYQADATQHICESKSIKNIQIKITDKENNDLYLQKFNFQLILEISYVYLDEERLYTQTFGTEKHPFDEPYTIKK